MMLKLLRKWNRKPCHRSRTRSRGDARAQAMVEFALILPILLLLVIAIIDFGRALFVYSEVSNASREAARYGASADAIPDPTTNRLNCSAIEARARGMFSILPTTLQTTVYVEHPSGGQFQLLPCTGTSVALGDRVKVHIQASIELLVLQFVAPLSAGRVPTTWPIAFEASRSVVTRQGFETGPTTTPRPTKNFAPPEPSNFQLTCSGLKVSGTWTEGAPNLSYRIYNAAGGAPVWSGSGNSAANFTTVQSGVPNSFNIVSVSATGLESNPVAGNPNPITCTSIPPGPVRNFTLTPICSRNRGNDINVTWQAPNTGGPVDHYVIYDASGAAVSGNLSASTTSFTLNRAIDQGQLLSFSIIAYNVDGLAGPTVSQQAGCGVPTNTPTNTPRPTDTPTITPTPRPTDTPTITPTPTATPLLPGPAQSFVLSSTCAKRNNNDVLATWLAPITGGPVNHYVIYDSTGTNLSGNLPAATTSFTIASVINQGQLLSFSIIAYDIAGRAGPTVSVQISCGVPTNTPTPVVPTLTPTPTPPPVPIVVSWSTNYPSYRFQNRNFAFTYYKAQVIYQASGLPASGANVYFTTVSTDNCNTSPLPASCTSLTEIGATGIYGNGTACYTQFGVVPSPLPFVYLYASLNRATSGPAVVQVTTTTSNTCP